ncbi:MAG: hypothetical protein H6968_13460 [Chromatiaceae bacterium]|nr:hypothetical protein [Chromatiaceae bacterium]
MKINAVNSIPNRPNSTSLMDFDKMSRIIAAARAERAKFIAAQLRALGQPWRVAHGLDDFIRASRLIGIARNNRSAYLKSLLPAWLRMNGYKSGGAGRPKYS